MLNREIPYEVFAGKWLEFEDRHGLGWAQPDFYCVTGANVICWEAKLTQSVQGRLQIDELYRPLLRRMYSLPVVGILVCKNLREDPGKWQIYSSEEVMDLTRELTFTWHYVS